MIEVFRQPFAELGGNLLLKYAKAFRLTLSIIVGMSAYSSLGYAQTAIVQAHNDYRNYTLRRHNDIQGVEAIYDDYRRRWLRRHTNDIALGGGDHGNDTPYCSTLDEEYGERTSTTTCGTRHIFRSIITGYSASDSYVGDADETGALGYVGYEYLFNNDAFLGIGFSSSRSTIEHSLNGSTLEVDARDNILHFLAGYMLPGEILNTWNISYGEGTGNTVRNGNITGKYDLGAFMLSGVFAKDYELDETWDMSFSLDYTLNWVIQQDLYVDSANVTHVAPHGWNGDFTATALFARPTQFGEAFARVGSTVEVLNPTDRPIDFTLDLGGSTKLSDAVAITGSIGGSFRPSGYTEGRASIRVVGKF